MDNLLSEFCLPLIPNGLHGSFAHGLLYWTDSLHMLCRCFDWLLAFRKHSRIQTDTDPCRSTRRWRHGGVSFRRTTSDPRQTEGGRCTHMANYELTDTCTHAYLFSYIKYIHQEHKISLHVQNHKLSALQTQIKEKMPNQSNMAIPETPNQRTKSKQLVSFVISLRSLRRA